MLLPAEEDVICGIIRFPPSRDRGVGVRVGVVLIVSLTDKEVFRLDEHSSRLLSSVVTGIEWTLSSLVSAEEVAEELVVSPFGREASEDRADSNDWILRRRALMSGWIGGAVSLIFVFSGLMIDEAVFIYVLFVSGMFY